MEMSFIRFQLQKLNKNDIIEGIKMKIRQPKKAGKIKLMANIVDLFFVLFLSNFDFTSIIFYNVLSIIVFFI